MALSTNTRPTPPRTVLTPTGQTRPGRRDRAPGPLLPTRRVALAAGLLTAFFVAALLVGGGGPPPSVPGLTDAGAVTGWGRPVVDLAGRVLAVLTVGQLAYAALLAPAGPGAGTAGALRGSTWSASGWLVAEVGALVLSASSVHAVPVTALSPQDVLAVLTQLPVGRAAAWVVVLLAVVVVGSAGTARGTAAGHQGRTRTVPGLLLLAAVGAVVLPGVLAGHSAAADHHLPAVLALSVHVVTASLWVGGLAGLLLHGRDRADAVHAVRRFSTLALACVVLLTASGAVAAVLVAGAPTLAWVGQGWVLLLGLKTALLGVLTALGWWHRRRTVPALAAGAPRAFVRLGVVEVAVMTLTLTLSVALAASPAPTPAAPPAPAQTSSSPGAPPTAAPDDDTPDDDAPDTSDAPAQSTVEDMSGHDHGDLSVSILVDEDRFHVAGTVRPGQPVTVYNRSGATATITALDASFDAEVGPRTFITFPAPAAPGDYAFVSRPEGVPSDGFADTLMVRADP